MSHYVEFLTADGAVVRVESTAPAPAAYGMQPVGRGGEAVVRAAETFEHALGGVRAAAEAALTVLRDGSLRPDTVEIEFGVKLSAEAGALIARTAADAHLTVKLSWSPGGGAERAGH
ncbi:CU044_2847 family protein [Kitasatospora sp. KL5]|uniref:CU044_2847 family protein n=1 Tax=Kitasatospora sp. KL5 TaxID=3425125 RepID=UPI003D6FB941